MITIGCRDIAPLLEQHAAGDIPPLLRDIVTGHVRDCDRCRSELEQWDQAQGEIAAWVRAAAPRPVDPAYLDGMAQALHRLAASPGLGPTRPELVAWLGAALGTLGSGSVRGAAWAGRAAARAVRRWRSAATRPVPRPGLMRPIALRRLAQRAGRLIRKGVPALG